MWVRYKYKFAYGGDKKWTYLEIQDDWKDYGYGPKDWAEDTYKKDKPYDETKALGEFLAEEMRLNEEYDWSDKFRGFDYEAVDGLPPNDVLLDRLTRARSNAEHWSDEIKRFQAMVDTTGTITKDDFNV